MKILKATAYIYFFFVATYSLAQDTLYLEDAIKLGLENNYSIKIARNNEKIAANNNTLGNAGFLPSLGADFSYIHSENNVRQIRAYSGRDSTIVFPSAVNTSTSGGIRLDWTIFNGFDMFVSKEQLGHLERLGRTQSEVSIDNLVANITVTYFNIVQQEKLVAVLQEAIELSHVRRKLAESRLQFGAGSELTVLQATVDLNADSSRLVQQIAAIQTTKAELNRLMGRNPQTQFVLHQEIVINPSIVFEEFLSNMKSQNPQLQEAKINNSVAALEVRSAQSWFWPRVNVFAEYGFNRTENTAGFASFNRSYGPSYGLTASWTLFSGFNSRRLIQNSKINRENTEERLQQLTLDIETEYFKIFNEYQANLKLVGIEQANVKVAEQNVEIALETYRLGRISDFDFRQTQQRLIDAEGRLISAEYLAKQAETELLRLSGGLMDKST